MPVNLPNAITICRILLVPITVWLIISGANLAAFVTFLVAGLSDAVDGFLARTFGAQTELGAYLDPIADKALLVRQVLKFFGVSSVDSWRLAWGNLAAQYRGQAAREKRPGYVAAWLRMGDLQAEGIATAPFDADEFKRTLSDVRKMSMLPASAWVKEMPVRCAAAGVAVVFTREIPNAAVSGATRWLTKDKALIQLSLKFKFGRPSMVYVQTRSRPHPFARQEAAVC